MGAVGLVVAALLGCGFGFVMCLLAHLLYL